MREQLLKILGLGDEGTDEQILQKVKVLQSDATVRNATAEVEEEIAKIQKDANMSRDQAVAAHAAKKAQKERDAENAKTREAHQRVLTAQAGGETIKSYGQAKKDLAAASK